LWSDYSWETGRPIVSNTDKCLSSALSHAIRGDHAAVACLLLETGAYFRASALSEALCFPSRRGDIVMARLSLEEGADIDIENNYSGCHLYLASRAGHNAVVKLLLKQGAYVNAGPFRSDSALYSAVEEGHEGIVRLLLESGATVKKAGGIFSNPLVAAAMARNERLIRLLLDNGRDQQTTNENLEEEIAKWLHIPGLLHMSSKPESGAARGILSLSGPAE
jgi:ankyrin repeat protein